MQVLQSSREVLRRIIGYRDWMSFRRDPEGSSQVDVIVCQMIGESVHCVHVRQIPEVKVSDFAINSKQDRENLLPSLGKQCNFVAVLPKSCYVIKTVEIPTVPTEQVTSMLSLEAESLLPKQFGTVEISYRSLPKEKERGSRYEVYICRQKTLVDYLNSMAALGIHPDFVLPSAVAWKDILTNEGSTQLVVAFSNNSKHAEVASLRPDGGISLRTFDDTHDSSFSTVSRGLLECIRSELTKVSSSSLPITVDWIGGQCPGCFSINGSVVIRDANVLSKLGFDGSASSIDVAPLPYVTAASLLGVKGKGVLHTANLLPRQMVLERLQRSVFKRLLIGAVMVVLAAVLSYVTLRIAILRYERLRADLSGKVALIKTEGEDAGRRVSQLKAIHAMLSTRNDFYGVIEGLYDATPDGITYSHIEVTDSGIIHIRGQSESVSQPFLLPERFEKSSVFSKVVLRNVGQKSKGGGSVTEFSVDCTLERLKTR